MAKYLLLKHYRGGKAPTNDVPVDQWGPGEWDAHSQFMEDFAQKLVGTGEFVAPTHSPRTVCGFASTARGAPR